MDSTPAPFCTSSCSYHLQFLANFKRFPLRAQRSLQLEQFVCLQWIWNTLCRGTLKKLVLGKGQLDEWNQRARLDGCRQSTNRFQWKPNGTNSGVFIGKVLNQLQWPILTKTVRTNCDQNSQKDVEAVSGELLRKQRDSFELCVLMIHALETRNPWNQSSVIYEDESLVGDF